MLSMVGDIGSILDEVTSGRSVRKKDIIRRVLDILVGLSLKGYEGKAVGTIFLVGDIEGIRRHTSQMIINPFKGWKDINVMDERQQLTFESFSQLDGAFVVDSRGYAHYAGRMIMVKPERSCDTDDGKQPRFDRKGTGTRWRAAKYITEKTKAVAVTLSNRGDITVFERGKEIGRIERRIIRIKESELPMFLVENGPK